LDTEEQRVKRRKGSNGDSLWNDSKSGAFPASYYTLTERQMHENGYPKPEIAEISSTKQNTLGFVRTRSAAVTSKPWEMVAIDCEMCCTSEGLELTRVSMVDPLGNVILDKLVKPKNAITNYNTQFSGITADMLQDVTTTLEDVREEILMVVSAEMILVGHSVENDLLALKIYHPLVIDTALLYQHPERGSSYKPALRALTSRFLRRRIQENKNGHDSIEDARAAMDLTLLKIKNGPAFGRRMKPYCENLIQVLSNHERSCTLIGNRTMLHHYAVGSCNAVLANSDNDVLARAEKEVRKASVDFLWLQFSELQSYYEGEAQNLKAMALHVAEMASLLTCNKGAKTSTKIKPCLSQDLQTVLTQLDDRIRRLHEALPLNSLMITFSGHGDTPGVRWLQELKWKSLQLPKRASSEQWTPHNEAVLEEYAAQAETTLAFVCTKT
jgi:RNA exonuclease 1